MTADGTEISSTICHIKLLLFVCVSVCVCVCVYDCVTGCVCVRYLFDLALAPLPMGYEHIKATQTTPDHSTQDMYSIAQRRGHQCTHAPCIWPDSRDKTERPRATEVCNVFKAWCC